MKTGEEFIGIVLANNLNAAQIALKQNPMLSNYKSSKEGITALMAASGSGLFEMSRLLISQPDIDLRIRDLSGRTALEHSRIFPQIMHLIAKAMYPNWQEPKNNNPS